MNASLITAAKILRGSQMLFGSSKIVSADLVRSASTVIRALEPAKLPPKVKAFVEESVSICQPQRVHICDGTEKENSEIIQTLQRDGMIRPLTKYENCWLARTDPADVARVESKTVISTARKSDTIPTPSEGVQGSLGYWLSRDDMEKAFHDRFPGSMKGRTMYVLPFSMGPIGSPLSKIGIQLTDSAYVVASMRIMTRMGQQVLDTLASDEFVKCLHSVGQPLPSARTLVNNWPCNPEKTLIAHIPERNEIVSFGSGYGGNSLLGKKCFALRLGSIIARQEGWLAEHMLILGVTDPKGKKRYVAAAFPSACGKTNMAMMNPTLPGYKVECVGDDIAWMRFDDQGQLRAINPEAGFFGVAPGTSTSTNPNAMLAIQKNTLFTNVAETADGGFFWEGLDKQTPENMAITSWLGRKWDPRGTEKAAHPNSRFCTPAKQCPIIDPNWEDPNGVPIDAILFGGRRAAGVPLVFESFSWKHGVLLGASMKSEATSAAEHKAGKEMNDPFAMRPFFGYNFGHYLDYWLSIENRPGLKLPKIFHVNWFRKNDQGQFMWPGFGENSRVLDWILRRIENEDCAYRTPIGLLPKLDTFNLDGMSHTVDMQGLFDVPRSFWLNEVQDLRKYFRDQVNNDLPEAVYGELDALEKRLLSAD